MKQAKRIFIFFLFTVFAATAANAQVASRSTGQDSADKIRIVSVSAVALTVDGAENEFTVEIEYTLESTDEGSIAIGFNTTDAGRFKMMTRKKVKKGTNFITLKAKVVPVDWKENGDFSVMANLSPYPLPRQRYTPLAGTTTVIYFTQ